MAVLSVQLQDLKGGEFLHFELLLEDLVNPGLEGEELGSDLHDAAQVHLFLVELAPELNDAVEG